MATSALGLQPSVASSSQTSSSDKKTSAKWIRYLEVLLERKKAADNGKGKGKPANWWQYLACFRAEKLVFVSSAAKVKQNDLRSMEELELPCTSEESFGSALADCILVRDFP
ncbi:TPA: hypothetical protein ACH3X1_012097 [Trebouxia sp. C0004]